MSDKKKNWFVRLGRVAGCLLVGVVVLVWVAKIWVVPSVVRGMAGAHLDDVWFGTVEIDDVDVNVFGPSYVRGVTLRDNLDRKWVNVPEVRVDVVWDGFVPRLRSVRVDAVNVSAQLVDGKCAVPLKRGESPGAPSDIAEIINGLKETEMTVGAVTVRAVNNVSKTDRTLDGITLPVELARAILRTNVDFRDIKWRGGKLSVDKATGVFGEDGLVVNLGGGIQGDRSVTFNAEIAGALCGGKLRGDIKAVFSSGAPSRLELEASAENVKMADLTRILAPDRIMEKGTGKIVVRAAISGADPESITGRAAFFLDDAHLWNTPILSALFEHMKIKMDKADIQSCFELAGTTATIVSGQLATTVWAADFEKGGTVDLDGGKVDLYVIFLPIKQAGALLNFVKAINPLRLVAKEVFRLHVTGTRDAPGITPVPFSDLTKLPTGALGLLKSVTTSGGQLGGDIFKAILNGGK